MLSSLTYLKAQLLAEALREGTEYDAQIRALGAGVAGALDNFCNRKFAYAANDTVIFSGDRAHYYLPRYPLNDAADLTVETRVARTDAWAELDATLTTNPQTGLLDFGFELGSPLVQVRVTYTGGYWFDTSEAGSGTLPAGATALADSAPDVLAAWLLQCKKVWEVADPLGGRIVPSKDVPQLVGLSLAGLELIPIVKEMLRPHMRYQLS